jgi:ATP-dependent helicase/nuclease subunit A
VEVTGPSPTLGTDIIGKIDRLVVTPTRITAVDFKTNATVPDDAKDTPEGLLRQMGAYREILQLVYPTHEIAVAILWSRTGTLMELPHDLVSGALKRARGA